MLNIAICDDDHYICEKLQNIIIEIINPIVEKAEFSVFYSGENLLKYLNEDNYFDIIFLDIELGLLNGVEVGKIIREKMNNEAVLIIYISGKESYAMELFDIRPFNFLIKPLEQQKINKVLNQAIDFIEKGNDIFEYNNNGSKYRVLIKDILYFESENRMVKMFMKEEIQTFYEKLDNIYRKLTEYNFLCIHKSYLVNYNHITTITYNNLTMSNGKTLDISQNRRKKIRELHLRFERNENNNDIN